MSGRRSSLPKSILLLLRNSWGEIEWFLPVLHRIKAAEPGARIYTVFPSDRFYDERAQNPTLFKLLAAASEHIFRPRDLIGVDTDWCWIDYTTQQRLIDRIPSVPPELAAALKRAEGLITHINALRSQGKLDEGEYERQMSKLGPLIHELRLNVERDRQGRSDELESAVLRELIDNRLKGVDIDLILRDDGADFRLHSMIMDRYPHVAVVRGSHGFDLTNRTKDDVDYEFLGWVSKVGHLRGRGDLWLTCSTNLSDSLDTYWSEKRSAVIGFPRLDRWWVETVLKESQEEIAAMGLPETDERILWIARQVADSCFDRECWLEIVRSTLSVIRERPGAHLVVKPHPRQDPAELLEELEALPRDRWTLWKGSTMAAAHVCDVVVSVWSSAILDALSVQKPVIEYFKYKKEAINQARGSDGQVTGGWREYGLAVPADTPAQVHELLDLWKRDPGHEVWQRQREAFARLHPEDADHTGDVLSRIETLFPYIGGL